jgi:hypothetical protein
MEGVKVPTKIALSEIGSASACSHDSAADRELAKLQAEFDSTENGVDPATPESLARLMQQIRSAHAELEAVAPEHRDTPEYQLAENCLKALIREYGIQDTELAARKV